MCNQDNKKDMKLQKIEVTLQEIQMATRPNVYKDKSKYTRKEKHKNKNRRD